MKRSTFVLFAAAVFGLSSGCANRDPAAQADAGESDEEGEEGEDGTEGEDGEGDGSGDGDGDDGGTETSGVWARGISLTRLDVNQGVAIPMAFDGAQSTASQRYSPVIQNRDAWIFAEVDVEDGWEARELEAKLILERADGTLFEATQTRTITKDTAEWHEDTTPMTGGRNKVLSVSYFEGFYFGIPAEEVTPYLKYRVEVYEVDDSLADTPEPDVLPSVPHPEEGYWWVGVEDDSYMNFRVTFVPIQYNYDGCEATPPTDEAYLKNYVDDLFGSNPTEQVEWYVREPFEWNETLKSGGGLSNLLGQMSELKATDDADPNMYYYALIDNCGSCISNSPGCIVGMAQLPGDSKSQMDNLQRVGSGLISPGPSTFTHEIGHAQGRRHIECQGAGAAGTDPTYPYSNGTLGSWGFDIVRFALHNAELGYDYMSYCGPSWVSNWQWNATYDRIDTLSSWELEGQAKPDPIAAEDPSAGLLVGTVQADGSGRWFTAKGGLAASQTRSAEHRVEFWQEGRLIADEAAQVVETAHWDSVVVGVPLPEGFDPDTTEIVHRGPQTRKSVELSPDRLHH